MFSLTEKLLGVPEPLLWPTLQRRFLPRYGLDGITFMKGHIRHHAVIGKKCKYISYNISTSGLLIYYKRSRFFRATYIFKPVSMPGCLFKLSCLLFGVVVRVFYKY